MNAYTTNAPVDDSAADAPAAPAAPEPRERELKLFVPASSIDGLWAHPWLVERAIGPLRVARIDNRYFDTPDRALAQRRMALRLRRIGRRWWQTLKVAEPDEGALSVRGEWEMPVAGPVLEWRHLRDTPLSTIVPQRGLAGRLRPVFTTNFRRESRLLRLKDGSVVEFAFDRGVIVSGRGRTRRVLPICEVEIEAKEGEPDLLKFAARLVRDIALVPLAASKAARGHRLAEAVALQPVRVDLPVPHSDDDVRSHLARVLVACNGALLTNAHALLEAPGADGGIEFVHQARVAVRRMRSALRTFGSVVERSRRDALDRDLAATGTMLGETRDWDVFATTMMKRLRDEVATDEAGKAAVEAVRIETAAQRDATHRRLTASLESGAFGATTIAVERLAARLMDQGGRRATLADRAPAWLEEQRDRLIRLSRRIAVLDTEARHGLRVEVKRLRYALDLLEGLYEPRAVKVFHDALADLQDKLGRLNDAVVAAHLLHSLPASDAATLVRARFTDWLHHHVKKQLPKVAALSVAFELTSEPWRVVPDPGDAVSKTSDLFGTDAPVPSARGASSIARDPAAIPLAERLRPCTIDQVIGQPQLLGPGKPLRVAFESQRPHSMILWGPPGVGKTTLARLMADAFEADFIALSAVLAGVKDIREAVARAELTRAQSGRQTIVFVDEVHRFNKSQQDAFLPHVESGLFVFIGATTENPSFEVNGALLSRAAVYVLTSLGADDMDALVERALHDPVAPELHGFSFTPSARKTLIASADGDARKLLNNLEIVVRAAAESKEIDDALLARALSENLRRFDKGGDAFYDQISALHKAVRGSHPDASLYWFCRMLDGGADPRYLARRMIRMASEDIGLADPRALRVTLDAADVYERLGTPEGELALAEAVVYLACAAKSNAVYKAYGAARGFVKQDGSRPVPPHIRNAPTKLMKDLGFGKEYRYAHDEPDAYAAGENYLPDGMEEPGWYQPVPRGLEAKIREKLAHLRALDDAARDGTDGGDP